MGIGDWAQSPIPNPHDYKLKFFKKNKLNNLIEFNFLKDFI